MKMVGPNDGHLLLLQFLRSPMSSVFLWDFGVLFTGRVESNLGDRTLERGLERLGLRRSSEAHRRRVVPVSEEVRFFPKGRIVYGPAVSRRRSDHQFPYFKP